MNETVEKSFEKKELKKYVLDIVSLNLCKLFFPVTYVDTGDRIKLIAHTDDYFPLCKRKSLSTAEGLTILNQVIRGIEQCRHRYITENDFDLSIENIYISKDKKLKMIFSPLKICGKNEKKISQLILAVENRCPLEGQKYFQKAADIYNNSEGRTNLIMRYLEEGRKEAALCGIK